MLNSESVLYHKDELPQSLKVMSTALLALDAFLLCVLCGLSWIDAGESTAEDAGDAEG